MNAVSEVEQAAGITLTAFRAWLMELQSVAAELHTRATDMRRAIDRKSDQPDHLVQQVHQAQYDRTVEVLGSVYAETLKQWRDGYEEFLSTYTDMSVRRSARLTRFNELFRAIFIDRHPAYSLYRHWYDVTEQAPEFPAPPTDQPTPQIDEAIPLPENDFGPSRYDDEIQPASGPGLRIPRLAILGGLGGIIVIVVLLLLANNPSAGEVALALTITDTPRVSATQPAESDTEVPAGQTGGPTRSVDAGNFDTPTLRAATDTPTATETAIPPSETPAISPTPLPTDTPRASATPSDTPTRTATPTATLPPAGVQGRQDLLALLNQMGQTDYPWAAEDFSVGTDGSYWRLGIGSPSEGDIIYVGLPPEMLESVYGNHAATRIRRVEVTLSLTTFNPPLLLDQAVFFGALLQDAENPQNSAGLQIQLVQNGVINLAQRVGSDVQTLSQRSVNAVIVRIRLERDPDSGAVSMFFNDEQIGQPVLLASADAPLIPMLFVKDGGVIVSVTDWQVNLR